MPSFADVSDMIARYDARTLGDLVSDDGRSVGREDLIGNSYLQTLLFEATGEIKAAVLRSQRYTAEELEDLIAAAQDGAEYLKGLCCQLAFWKAWQRKPYADITRQQEANQQIRTILEQLRKGDLSFDLPRHQEAGTPKTDTVTRVEIDNDWNLFVDQARGRFLPTRRTFRNR